MWRRVRSRPLVTSGNWSCRSAPAARQLPNRKPLIGKGESLPSRTGAEIPGARLLTVPRLHWLQQARCVLLRICSAIQVKLRLMEDSLLGYGFVSFFARQASLAELEQGRVGRVTEVRRTLIIVFDGSNERSILLTSSWHDAALEDRPTVGDWVVLDDRLSRVQRVLHRKSVFRRVTASCAGGAGQCPGQKHAWRLGRLDRAG